MREEPDHRTLPQTQPLPKRPLGKTGRQVTTYGLGGLFTVARHDRHDDAVEIVNRALDLGINDIDTFALYGNGSGVLNIGTVMRERRDEVFLTSKSRDDTYDGTMALVQQTLRRFADRLPRPVPVPFPRPIGSTRATPGSTAPTRPWNSSATRV